MLETAEFLSSVLGKVIVVTGAMRPERFSDSDAPINIGTAIGAIRILEEGVYIAMHGKVMQHHEVKRDLETGKYF